MPSTARRTTVTTAGDLAALHAPVPLATSGDTRTLRQAMIAVAIVATAVGWTAIGTSAAHGAQTTADEPQYLLTALSIAEDLDLDIADEIEDERYRPFSEVGLDPQTRILEGDRQVSPHDPLLPLLLAVPMGVGGWPLAKAALALTGGALAASTLWLAVRRVRVAVIPAALVVGAFAVTPPLTSYATQVYPELPAALAVTVVVGALTGPLERRGLAVALLGLVALPWLAVKYVPIAAVLGLVACWHLWRTGRRSTLGRFVVVLVVAGVAWLVAHRIVYGGWTAYAAGDHFVETGELSVVGSNPDLAGRSTRILGLLVDRGFGLGAWAPAYLLVVPALAAWIRTRPRHWFAVAGPFAVGWLTATFAALTMHGWWWPGRQLVVVLPLAVVVVAWWAQRWRAVVVTCIALSAVALCGWLWLVAETTWGELTLIVDFGETANPLYRGWRHVLPDGRHRTGATGPLTAVWWVVVAVLAGLGRWSARQPGQDRPAISSAA